MMKKLPGTIISLALALGTMVLVLTIAYSLVAPHFSTLKVGTIFGAGLGLMLALAVYLIGEMVVKKGWVGNSARTGFILMAVIIAIITLATTMPWSAAIGIKPDIGVSSVGVLALLLLGAVVVWGGVKVALDGGSGASKKIFYVAITLLMIFGLAYLILGEDTLKNLLIFFQSTAQDNVTKIIDGRPDTNFVWPEWRPIFLFLLLAAVPFIAWQQYQKGNKLVVAFASLLAIAIISILIYMAGWNRTWTETREDLSRMDVPSISLPDFGGGEYTANLNEQDEFRLEIGPEDTIKVTLRRPKLGGLDSFMSYAIDPEWKEANGINIPDGQLIQRVELSMFVRRLSLAPAYVSRFRDQKIPFIIWYRAG